MKTDQTTTTAEETELREIAFALTEYAASEDMSNAELLRSFPLLGSDKTLRCCARGNFEGLDVPRQLANYRAVRAELLNGGSEGALPVYEDLSTAKALRGAVSRLKGSVTLAKLIIVEGFTGSGKTTAAKIIEEKYNALSPQTAVYQVEASAGWNDRPNAMLEAILLAMGRDARARSQAARLRKCCDVLSERPVMLVLDEVHDLGVRCLRTLKTLLNSSPVKIILCCHPRLMRDLEQENRDDLSQLTGNRLLTRIKLGTLNEADVALILERRLPAGALGSKEDLARAAKFVAENSLNHGNLAFVREVIQRLLEGVKKGKKADRAALDEAVRRELGARK